MSERSFLEGCKKPKSFQEMLEKLEPYAKSIILTEPYHCTCGRVCKPGWKIFEVLTKEDIERIKRDPEVIESIKSEELAQKMCSGCYAKKMKEERPNGNRKEGEI